MLLRGLCQVVGGPVLLVTRLLRHDVGVKSGGLAAALSLQDEAGREAMLARLLTQLEVVASAGRGGRSEDKAKSAVAGLAGHGPGVAVESELGAGCDFEGIQLSSGNRV